MDKVVIVYKNNDIEELKVIGSDLNCIFAINKKAIIIYKSNIDYIIGDIDNKKSIKEVEVLNNLKGQFIAVKTHTAEIVGKLEDFKQTHIILITQDNKKYTINKSSIFKILEL